MEIDEYLMDDQEGGGGIFDYPPENYGHEDPVAAEPSQPQPLQFYPLSLAQVQPAQPQAPLMKKVGPLPMWAWLAIGGTAVGAGYLLYKNRKTEPSSSDEEEGSSRPSGGLLKMLGAGGGGDEDSGGGWGPSRSAFAGRLTEYFRKKGFEEHVVVWHDADEARAGGMTHVSPLINIQVKGGGVKCDTALQRFCRREGLNPVAHVDGSIGLYPHTGKRAKEWEEYIDALRDDGQSV